MSVFVPRLSALRPSLCLFGLYQEPSLATCSWAASFTTRSSHDTDRYIIRKTNHNRKCARNKVMNDFTTNHC
jgi:hypothetical protein